MKRLIILAALSVCISAYAQNPSTTWPYIYDNFTPGVIYTTDGAHSNVSLNVHVRHGRLHFIDGDTVKDADLSKVSAVTIGADKYIPVDGGLRKIVAEDANGFVTVSVLGDFAALQETGGAYGASSASSSTRKLSSVEFDSQVNQNHMLLLSEKENGAEIRTITTYWLMVAGQNIKAAKKDVENILPDPAKQNFKTWLKTNKIKWKDPQSLLKVVDFVAEAGI